MHPIERFSPVHLTMTEWSDPTRCRLAVRRTARPSFAEIAEIAQIRRFRMPCRSLIFEGGASFAGPCLAVFDLFAAHGEIVLARDPR